MQFKIVALAFTALTGFVHAQQLSAETLAGAINFIADTSQETSDLVRQITPFNPVAFVNAVPRVVNNFKALANTVASNALKLKGIEVEEPFSADGQAQVFDAFVNLVRVYKNLFDVLFPRSNIISSVGFGPAIAGALRFLEAGIDTLSINIIKFIPNHSEVATKGQVGLRQLFGAALDRF
ncbi:predicted protein [Verticillium alfalfae VaMs.102]|uniref:Predicted protein n=1 Tax=Verticillium alfalfae (strain VaMs.102 / ATCC MYA-4576 / FGSC 10136) TaxID=526221 RepID=C9SNV6_VERA1|nr:predicted protein [Verticillium alfalfae VaMs.102]EEY20471.1 predicted protein [Verticillium alfalfae VaMs.102]